MCSIPPETFIRHLHSHTTSNCSHEVIQTEGFFQDRCWLRTFPSSQGSSEIIQSRNSSSNRKGYITLKHTELLLKPQQVSRKTSESVAQKSRIASAEFWVQEGRNKNINKWQITEAQTGFYIFLHIRYPYSVLGAGYTDYFIQNNLSWAVTVFFGLFKASPRMHRMSFLEFLGKACPLQSPLKKHSDIYEYLR